MAQISVEIMRLPGSVPGGNQHTRRTGLPRNTIRKYLKASTVEPRFSVPERPSMLDPFAYKLAAWLKTETSKSRKQRCPLAQLHGDLVALRFTGSCNRVAAFARERRAERQPKQIEPGLSTLAPWSAILFTNVGSGLV
jgi:hypothetical protein